MGSFTSERWRYAKSLAGRVAEFSNPRSQGPVFHFFSRSKYMSTLKPTRRVSKHHKLKEDRVVTASSRIIDAASGNRNVLTIAGIAVIVLIAGFIGFRQWRQVQEGRAAEAIAEPVRAYEQGLYREALDGVAGSTGLTGVISRYGSTPTGNLARFYAADAHYKLGEYDQAEELFSDYDKGSDYLGASAYAGEAAILQQKGENARAAALFEKAADVFESELTTPQYLADAASAYEAAGNYSKATSLLERIKDDYASSQQARDVDMLLARVEAKAESR